MCVIKHCCICCNGELYFLALWHHAAADFWCVAAGFSLQEHASMQIKHKLGRAIQLRFKARTGIILRLIKLALMVKSRRA